MLCGENIVGLGPCCANVCDKETIPPCRVLMDKINFITFTKADDCLEYLTTGKGTGGTVEVSTCPGCGDYDTCAADCTFNASPSTEDWHPHTISCKYCHRFIWTVPLFNKRLVS